MIWRILSPCVSVPGVLAVSLLVGAGQATAEASPPRNPTRPTVAAGDQPPATSLALSAPMTTAGAWFYRQFCAGCHGAEGRGDGPAAAYVVAPPADLTGLSARNGGVFPSQQVIATIDGRTRQDVHGAGMPVWGMIFADEAQGQGLGLDASVLQTRERVLSLASYLETLQD